MSNEIKIKFYLSNFLNLFIVISFNNYKGKTNLF